MIVSYNISLYRDTQVAIISYTQIITSLMHTRKMQMIINTSFDIIYDLGDAD